MKEHGNHRLASLRDYRLAQVLQKDFPNILKEKHPMKIVHKTKSGERRETLLKEYFITASLIALLKRVGEEAARTAPASQRERALARVRH